MLIIGINPVLESLEFDSARIEKLILLEGISNKRIDEIIRTAERKKIQIERLPKAKFEEIIDKKDKSEGISQGVIAVAKEYEYAELRKILADCKDKDNAIIVVLDEIQDPHNLGAIIRTSAAAGVDGIVISEKNSAKVNHTVIKSSAGATNFVKIALSGNIYKAIEMIRQSDFKVYGTALKNSKNMYETEISGRCAIVFGSEGRGIRANITRLCDEMIMIPMFGKAESLNVSVSAGIVLYEVLRRSNY